MSVADSPLRDRVVFIQGAPRSGTTVLVTMLASHPQIGGVEAESHLFDFGVDRLFDNFERRHPTLHGLGSYIERREQLVDLARDLCDGVLMSMGSHVSLGSEPALVVEKTPTSPHELGLDLQRKRECFPDAWYVHIVRDGEAVTRSLMRAPWLSDRSRGACSRLWSEAVDQTRQNLGDLPRYREVSYEELRADPARVIGGLYQWLGVDSSEEVLEAVRILSRERFSDLGAVPTGRMQTIGRIVRRVAPRSRTVTLVRDGVNVVRRRLRPQAQSPPAEGQALASEFVRALRERDEDALMEITTKGLSFVYRSAEGDLLAEGVEAHRALLDLATALFTRRHIGEWWATTGVGAGEWWTSSSGQPFVSILLSALGGNASRVDLAFGLSVREGLIARIVVISAGPLGGRPLRALPTGALAEGLS